MNALEYAKLHQDRFLSELLDFLRIPSVSTQPDHKSDVSHAADWLRDRLLAAGFSKADVVATAGHPVLYAECLDAGSDAPTVLIYGHYDVQPPDPLDEWKTSPFEPAILEEDVFARGASDDKGQLYVHVKAVEALMETNGRLPVNVKCVFEGEEECGSPSLKPFVHEYIDLLEADVALISDTHILDKDIPSIVYGLRGIAYVEVEVTGPDHDLHSGTYGGAVHNPINALCAMIAQLHDADGRITIPGFYDQVRDLSREEREALSKVPFDREAWLKEAGVTTDWGESGYTIVERTSARPTLDVNGIWGGYTQPGAKTVLPSQAFAKISMRLVPDQEPAAVAQLIADYMEQIASSTVSVKVSDLHSGEGAIVRRDSPAMQAAFQAYAEVFGREPVFIREGGSIPVVALFQQALGIETVLMGFGLPDDRLHSPNEKFHLPNFYQGIETSIRFMEILGG